MTYLSVIIPAYNEERRILTTLQDVADFLRTQPYSAEVLVVDDGSSDGTAPLVETFSETNPAFRLIRNEHHGKAYTVRTGVLAAVGEYVLFTDADGATPIAEVNKLLPLLEQGNDVVIGSREGLGAKRFNEPWHRHVMGRVFNAIVQLLAVPGIHDTQCGFKAFRQHASRDLFQNMQLYREGMGPVQGAMLTGFDVEILFMARKWGYRIAEVPVHWYYGEESKVSPLKDSWRNLRDVILVRCNDLQGRYRRDKRTA